MPKDLLPDPDEYIDDPTGFEERLNEALGRAKQTQELRKEQDPGNVETVKENVREMKLRELTEQAKRGELLSITSEIIELGLESEVKKLAIRRRGNQFLRKAFGAESEDE